MSDYRFLRYEEIDDAQIVRIGLNRPRQRNAQHRGLLVELNDAFQRAERDDRVKVVVLHGIGTMFSSGHDLGSTEAVAERGTGPERHPTFDGHGGARDGIEQNWLQEYHFYLSNTRRWRELRKITIASVHGGVIAAGLMLMWACDLIVADETAYFADPVAPRLGVSGVEYFAHPWEWGSRRAKDLLMTGDAMGVDEAYEIGAVNKVFPAGTLEDNTVAFARRICAVPTAASLMIKEAVNQAQDNMGFHNALQGSFTLHELNHAQWGVLSGGESLIATPELGGRDWQEAGPIRPTSKTEVVAP
ncbi:enoyl-CoA hydratase [Pseudonocardia sp. RS010]|uniref:enoyl-CoA hydratase n=1 Tax=Pseudonocardia sp. RS010 TaxID=3385979 RepID=UPI0039A01ED0